MTLEKICNICNMTTRGKIIMTFEDYFNSEWEDIKNVYFSNGRIFFKFNTEREMIECGLLIIERHNQVKADMEADKAQDGAMFGYTDDDLTDLDYFLRMGTMYRNANDLIDFAPQSFIVTTSSTPRIRG